LSFYSGHEVYYTTITIQPPLLLPLSYHCFSDILYSLLLPSSYHSYYNSQASTHRADYTMSELAVVPGALASTSASAPALRTGREINTATDLARLRAEGTMLTTTELKELNARIKTLEDMAKLEDRLRLLENRKRTSDAITSATSQDDPFIQNPSLAPGFSGYQASVIRQSIKPGGSDHSESSSKTANHRRHKQQRNNRGIKIIPSYTLKVNSSLREWGD
jgi:hypothetical protein